RVRRRFVGGDEVRRHDLGDLVLGRPPVVLDELHRREMTCLAFGLRESLVGDYAQEILQEPVLTSLGRAWIGLQAEDLLPNERREHALGLLPGHARRLCRSLLVETLAEDRGVLDEPALVG